MLFYIHIHKTYTGIYEESVKYLFKNNITWQLRNNSVKSMYIIYMIKVCSSIYLYKCQVYNYYRFTVKFISICNETVHAGKHLGWIYKKLPANCVRLALRELIVSRALRSSNSRTATSLPLPALSPPPSSEYLAVSRESNVAWLGERSTN